MSSEWDEYAEGWDSDPAVKRYAKQAFDLLARHMNIDGFRILDFGCGTGALTELMQSSALEIVAIDPSVEMIKVLEQKSFTNVMCIADYLSGDLIKSSEVLRSPFDLVVASSVCSFLPDYEGTLALLKSLIKRHGHFVQWDWQTEDLNEEFGLSKSRVSSALSKSGFNDIEVSTAFTMESQKGTAPVLMAIGKA